jgi:sugar phosphate isomerase/epimerase
MESASWSRISPGDYNNAAQLGELLNPLPDLGLHLDIGHANLLVPANTTSEILAAFGDRLRHVHLHDNKGGHEDLHLPLGAANIDVRRAVHALKDCKYDSTITLEVFSPDRHYRIRRRSAAPHLGRGLTRRRVEVLHAKRTVRDASIRLLYVSNFPVRTGFDRLTL